MNNQGVNVLDNTFRTTVRKDVPFIEGAYVEFWDSVMVTDILQAEKSQSQAITLDTSLDILIRQIASWNFTNGEISLPITKQSVSLFTDKLLTWLFQAQHEVLDASKQDKKKSQDNSSNTSDQTTQIA